MACNSYVQLVRYKQWADRALCDVLDANMERLDIQDKALLLRVLDHFHVVDQIFQHHLREIPHAFDAPRSQAVPEFRTLARGMEAVDDWFVSYVSGLTETDFDRPVDFVFTNGMPARMRRGEIILHVCLHGTYHRGNAGALLQQKGIVPNADRMTDFLEEQAGLVSSIPGRRFA
jgi:uncharacterized damage-inducible protein DinB